MGVLTGCIQKQYKSYEQDIFFHVGPIICMNILKGQQLPPLI
jgi:hypothetical protein